MSDNAQRTALSSHLVARAPVRISFGGGGTDLAAYYSRFGGLVVSAAITRYAYVIARRPAHGGIGINSADYRAWETFRPGAAPRGDGPAIDEPLALPKAALTLFAEHGLYERGVELFLASEAPPGSGLGSSSAMAVALVQALAAYVGAPMDAARAAETASVLEIERLGMPIGRQDQYASAFGGLNSIEFSADGVRVAPLGVPPGVVEALGANLLLFSTGRTRNSAAILHQQREDSRTNAATIASLHRIKALAERIAGALRNGDLELFGALLDLGWQEKRGLSSNISTAAIDGWYEAARAAGALGGKITGAGGGGFLLLYCPPARHDAVRAAMTRCGLPELTFDLDPDGAVVVAHHQEPPGAGT